MMTIKTRVLGRARVEMVEVRGGTTRGEIGREMRGEMAGRPIDTRLITAVSVTNTAAMTITMATVAETRVMETEEEDNHIDLRHGTIDRSKAD